MPSQKDFTVLLVDDDHSVLDSISRNISKDGYNTLMADNGRKALAILQNQLVNAAVFDLKMPSMSGIELLKLAKEMHPELMVLILTGHGGVEEAVEAMRLGAVDFLEKPYSWPKLRARIAQLWNIWRLSSENKTLRSRLCELGKLDDLVGESKPIIELKKLISKVAETDVGVLIQGETGTGKELVAKAIHNCSNRSNARFVPVDCASIGETLMESELFGHAKGSFTGAHTASQGLIRWADGGTLFLDEIGELALNVQSKLLRTLQEKQVRPVGSEKSYDVDVRILAATNRDLLQEVESGNFREDLFFRLNVVNIRVPTLAERREDIPLLVKHFMDRHKSQGYAVPDITDDVLNHFERKSWPGNIRELENTVQRAAALGAWTIGDAQRDARGEEIQDRNNDGGGTAHTMEHYEKMAIKNALSKADGNRKDAAEILGIGEATLYRKIKKYHL